MNKMIIEIQNQLIRLGWPETHERIQSFLARAGVTCVEGLTEKGQQVLLSRLKVIPADLLDALSLLSCHCDRLGISQKGLWLTLWLDAKGIPSLQVATIEQVLELCEVLSRCQPEAYTVPINREIRAIRTELAEIVNILRRTTPER
jgi:hypothetical protein